MNDTEIKVSGLRGWFTSRPWLVAGVAAAVVLGPAATTATALERANAAPVHRPWHKPQHRTPQRNATAATTALVVTREDRYTAERTR
ncbi:hypothetical protein [Streptacidiphilus carbonis]|jgi:hypothetical protein|uniref:hypothetical protein n=1 Tax=Streptacidiphilus carbonis TaxID=105422 RepID=UPI0005AB7B11|nr:hypothetical protein [Streptacidiphilus carbonis]